MSSGTLDSAAACSLLRDAVIAGGVVHGKLVAHDVLAATGLAVAAAGMHQRPPASPPPPPPVAPQCNTTDSRVAALMTTTSTRWSLTTPFFGANKTLEVRLRGRPHKVCAHASRRAVLVAVPGGTGCRQFGHFLFNFVMPLWHAFRVLGWQLPARAHVFVDCTGRGLGRWGGTKLHKAPPFVHEAARVLLGDARLRSLPRLLERTAAAPRCFRRMLVGMGCARLDHYNPQMPEDEMRTFRNALTAAVTRKPLALAWRGRTAGSALGMAVLLVGRRTGRTILNERALFEALMLERAVSRGRSRLVYFGQLTLAEQMRASAAADVMIAMHGTGTANALWMRPGSLLISVFPYGADVAVPHLSINFFRMLRAVGVRVARVATRDFGDTVVADRLAWCAGCLRNRSLHMIERPAVCVAVDGSVVREPAVECADRNTCPRPCGRTLGHTYGCVFSQHTRVRADVVAALVRDAAAAIATRQAHEAAPTHTAADVNTAAAAAAAKPQPPPPPRRMEPLIVRLLEADNVSAVREPGVVPLPGLRFYEPSGYDAIPPIISA